jgi:exonuclease VII large subunit
MTRDPVSVRGPNEEGEDMKWHVVGLCLAAFSATIRAQEADPCTGLVGVALGQCQDTQQKLQRQQLAQQQQQLAQQQQQLAQQQQQLAQQQQLLAQQQEQLKRQQEQLGQQHQQMTKQQEHPRQQEVLNKQVEREELKSWKADNPWFGSDYAKTQFATRYARQLEEEQPDLVGRPLLDAISAKVRDKFGAR